MPAKIYLYARYRDGKNSPSLWGQGRDYNCSDPQYFVVWGQPGDVDLMASQGVHIARRRDHGSVFNPQGAERNGFIEGLMEKNRKAKEKDGYEFVGVFYGFEEDPRRWIHLSHIDQDPTAQKPAPEPGSINDSSGLLRQDAVDVEDSLYF